MNTGTDGVLEMVRRANPGADIASVVTLVTF